MRKLSPITIGLLFTVLAGGLMLLADRLTIGSGAVWNEFYTELDTVFYFCETPAVDDLFRHKTNTYSNLAFFFIGIVMLVYSGRDRAFPRGKFIQRHRLWSLVFGIAGIFIFLGSSFFHASLTRFAEFMDLLAVYSVAWVPVAFNLHRLICVHKGRDFPAGPYVWGFVMLVLVSALLIFRVPAWYLVPSILVLITTSALLVQWRSQPAAGWPWFIASISCSFVAATFFAFDINRVFCTPDGFFQPHGAWHVMAAAASGTFYGYMRKVEYRA